MGVIQGSINNLLTIAAASAKLSPVLEEKRELTTLKKAYEKTDELLKTTDYETYNESIAKEQADKARRIAELSPTEENIRTYLAEAGGYESVKPENIEAEQQLSYSQRARAKANKDAEEALKTRQEEASNEFRRMFTEGGKYR